MAFFTRPDFDGRQFKQETGSTITLSGTTNFAGILKSKNVEIDADLYSGLTLMTGHVLTLISDGGTPKIRLEPSTGGGGGSIYYTGNTPAVLSSPVGGIDDGYVLTGKTFTQILEDMLIETLNPAIVNPSHTLTDNQANVQEVGVTLNINLTSCFTRGSITPQYDATGACIAPSTPRSGLANCYCYNGGTPPISCAVPSVACSNSIPVNSYQLCEGSACNTWSSCVFYDASATVAYDSSGGVYSPALSDGNTTQKNQVITGIYPWFYGTSASANPRPTPNSALLTTGTKVVAAASGTVNANFNTSGAEWTWVAIPASYTVKTVWYVNALNNGTIGGVYPSGNKYPIPSSVSVNSPTALWSGINYNFYISELPSIETNIEFRNS